MPKEHKKRGRRAEEKKRKFERSEDDPASKRHKHIDDDFVENSNFISLGDHDHQTVGYEDDGQLQEDAAPYAHPGEMPFYGMLDEEEQEYFKRADEILEINDFPDPEDRSTFLANVYKEAEGKELKMANSQSCSRLMERLILLSTPSQLKNLFKQFSTHFLHLVQHRFASHCCEALFIHGAPVVTAESKGSKSGDDSTNSMESLYLQTISELEEYLGYLITDRFASHTLRVLLVVLSGQPLEQSASKSLLQSRKKEHVSITSSEMKGDLRLETRAVPDSFMEALERIISKSVSGLDSTYIRALASHQTGNPTIQLLLQLELTLFGKQRAKDESSIVHKFLPDDPITEENDSGKFVNGLIYDPVGSRLLETIVEFAPGKMFKSMFRHLFKQKLGKLARNDTASYVVSKILCRLSKDDLAEAVRSLCTEMPVLAERNRTAVIKTLVERCAIRKVDTAPLVEALESAYGVQGNFDITCLLRLTLVDPMPESSTLQNGSKETSNNVKTPEKLHGSLLAQAMIAIPGALSSLIFDSLAELGSALSISLAKDPSASHTVQAALTSPTASVIFRRKMIQQYYGHIGEMALDPSASHVIDAMWAGTHGLAFIRERIAEELAENEADLRESFVGRAVWRNWKMDLYKRKRKDWVDESRSSAGTASFIGFREADRNQVSTRDGTKVDRNVNEKENGVAVGGRQLTAIEKARQRHAIGRAEKADRGWKSNVARTGKDGLKSAM